MHHSIPLDQGVETEGSHIYSLAAPAPSPFNIAGKNPMFLISPCLLLPGWHLPPGACGGPRDGHWRRPYEMQCRPSAFKFSREAPLG